MCNCLDLIRHENVYRWRYGYKSSEAEQEIGFAQEPYGILNGV